MSLVSRIILFGMYLKSRTVQVNMKTVIGHLRNSRRICKNAFLVVYCLYGYKYSLVLLETWYSDDEASLLRNVNNNYGLVFSNFHMDLSNMIRLTWICLTWIC